MHRNRNQLRSRTDSVTKPETWSNKVWNALSKYDKAIYGDPGGDSAENILNLESITDQKIKNMWEKLTPAEQIDFIDNKGEQELIKLYPENFVYEEGRKTRI
eukprot:Pgem_evm1s16007